MYDVQRPWWDPRRPAGFRFSPADAAVVAVALVVTAGLWHWEQRIACVPALVLGHFFLFCNVFRVGRIAEYVWAAIFVLNACGWILAGRLEWTAVVLTQSPVTIAVIVATVGSTDYRGVGHEKLRSRGRRARRGVDSPSAKSGPERS